MFWEILAIVLLVFSVIMIIMYGRVVSALKQSHFDKSSQSVKYGKMSEQFMPFLNDYPFEKGNFRFIGNPIDGVQFENDKIIFVEFKTGDSRLTPKQDEIRRLVEDKKIEFLEFRIQDKD